MNNRANKIQEIAATLSLWIVHDFDIAWNNESENFMFYVS